MKYRAVLLALAGCLSVASALAEPPPALSEPQWAQGRHGAMHMLLEATIFKFDVLTVDVRVGKAVQRRLDQLIGNRPYSPQLAEQLAQVLIGADELLVQVQFLRNISFQQWLDGVLQNLEQAETARLISGELRRRIEARLPVAFASLEERGYQSGDRLFYRLRADGLRTVVVSGSGTIRLDFTDARKEAGHVVCASYFTPNGVFREPLLRSLFE